MAADPLLLLLIGAMFTLIQPKFARNYQSQQYFAKNSKILRSGRRGRIACLAGGSHSTVDSPALTETRLNTSRLKSYNALWSALAMEELARLGVKHVCIGPGSRSTPLTIAAAENPKLETIVHYDERSLGFYALGLAKGSKTPVAIITTSGTAVPNLMPAIAEARQDHIPLLVLSADRPAELLDCGANQAIRQPNMFANFAVYDQVVPCPTHEIPPSFILSTIDYAFSKAKEFSAPIHLNFHFREPLSPPDSELSNSIPEEYYQTISRWLDDQEPQTTYFKAPKSLVSPTAITKIQHLIQTHGNQKMMIIAGNLKSDEEAHSVVELAREWKVPLFTDVCSQLRLQDIPGVLLLSDGDTCANEIAADPNALIFMFGDRFVSKTLLTSLSRGRPTFVQITPYLDRQDPNHMVTLRVESEIASAVSELLNLNSSQEGDNAFLDLEEKGNDIEIEEILESEQAFSTWVCSAIGPNTSLYLGNSMPIRYIDRNAKRTVPFGGSSCNVYANRGASGIDGVLSSALGVAHATNKHILLLIGDLSLLHDIGALQLARGLRVTIVLVNNDGGIIFRKLPVARQKHLFREFFQAPHGIHSFSNAAAHFGIDYTMVNSSSDIDELRARIQEGNPSSPKIFEYFRAPEPL